MRRAALAYEKGQVATMASSVSRSDDGKALFWDGAAFMLTVFGLDRLQFVANGDDLFVRVYLRGERGRAYR